MGSRADRRGSARAVTAMGLLGIAGALALAAGPARAQEGHWDEGRQWASVRAGYAKSKAYFAADGGFGYGFSYSWFVGRSLSWSASLQHDVLGRIGSAAEIEIPVTTEFNYHFRWGGSTRMYMGGGWGAVYHKTYRTGADESGFRQGVMVTTGVNAAVDPQSLVGIDFRIMLENGTRSINPTFPNIEPSSSVWGAKLSYSRVF